ncbi:hypothetical protein BKA69DRAFT_392086 [Paraphysoderma sedebokerense]|nr:hypothetical protein BKA69DRAFT_392086 [Paraphysoderma sedebokerense]
MDVNMPPTTNYSIESDGSCSMSISSWPDTSDEENCQPGAERMNASDNNNSQLPNDDLDVRGQDDQQSVTSALNSGSKKNSPPTPNEQSALPEAENIEDLDGHDEHEPQTPASNSDRNRAKETVNPPYGSNDFGTEASANEKPARTKTKKDPSRGNKISLVRPNAICDWGFQDFKMVCPTLVWNNNSSQATMVIQAEEVFVQLMDPRRPSAKSIHDHKCALQTLGHMIGARDDIEHKDLIEKAINSYVEKALVTIDVLIMFEARAKGSIDRFLLFTPSAIDAWSPWSVKNQADIVKEYIEQVDAELKYIREAAMLAHGMLFETNEDLVTVAKYSMESLSNLNMPAESRLDVLWDLVAGSSSMTERRYLENREILASVVNTTKEGTASLGNIVLLIKNFQHTLDDLKRSTSQGLVTKPNSGQLQMIRKAIERLEETRRGFDRKLPSTVESDNLLN